MIERRHQIEIGDPFGLDQRQSLVDVESAQADEGATDERHRNQGAHAHGVIERHDAERSLAVGVEILRHVGDPGGALGALPPRHPFRPRGGAGRVEHHGPCVGAPTRGVASGCSGGRQHGECDGGGGR